MIYIDLTDLSEWTGGHGGTQRVVYNIARNFAEESDLNQLAFVKYSDALEGYVEADYQNILFKKDESIPEDTMSPHVGRKMKVKNLVRKSSPDILKQNRLARSSYHKTIKVLKNVKSVYEQKKYQPNIEEKIEIEHGSKILLLGKPWDNLNIQKNIIKLKKEKNIRVYQVVYDQIITLYPHLHHPSLFVPYTKSMINTCLTADHLFAISESTKEDTKKFCNELNIKCPPISVIRLGDNPVEQEAPTHQKYKSNQKYILSVGTFEIRKNYNLLYLAYKLAKERGIDLPDLIIVGEKGWLSNDIYDVISHDNEVNTKITIKHGIPDNELVSLYRGCQFTVYPSMYEGWGLPIAESLNYGKVCLSSHTSSMKEIAGDLNEYFSPYNPEQCLNLILKYCDLDNLRNAENAIKASYQRTSWKSTYEQIKIYL